MGFMDVELLTMNFDARDLLLYICLGNAVLLGFYPFHFRFLRHRLLASSIAISSIITSIYIGLLPLKNHRNCGYEQQFSTSNL